MKRSLCIACAWLWAISPGFGQSPLSGVSSTASPGPNRGEYTVSYTVSHPTIARTFVQGRPYSGEEISQQTKTLPDGMQAVQEGPSAFTYRDSAGRIRTERHAPRPMGAIMWVEAPVVPEICDPVAGFIYYLDQVNRVAHRVQLPPDSMILPAPPAWRYTSSTTTDKSAVRKTEPLGKTTIEGIDVQGSRTTTTYPAGALGNDRPIVATMEIWRSEELGLIVLSKSSDPRVGETTNAIINISREEPDPALFRVPPGYKMVDQTKVPFTFTIVTTGTRP